MEDSDNTDGTCRDKNSTRGARKERGRSFPSPGGVEDREKKQSSFIELADSLVLSVISLSVSNRQSWMVGESDNNERRNNEGHHNGIISHLGLCCCSSTDMTGHRR